MPNNYTSIRKYFDYVNSVSTVTNKFIPGYFYSYEYRYDRKDKTYFDLKFYDRFPLVFLIGKGPGENTYIGLNFHQIPVRSRLIWLTKFDKICDILKEDVRAVYRYEFLKAMFKKATFGVRVYRVDRVFKLRKIDSREMQEISRFYSKTYHGANIDLIDMRYAQHNPYKY